MGQAPHHVLIPEVGFVVAALWHTSKLDYKTWVVAGQRVLVLRQPPRVRGHGAAKMVILSRIIPGRGTESWSAGGRKRLVDPAGGRNGLSGKAAGFEVA